MTSGKLLGHRAAHRIGAALVVVTLVALGCNTAPPTTPPASGPVSSPVGEAPDTCPDVMIVTCQFQATELSIPVIGTTFSLHYSSTRAAGRRVAPSDPEGVDVGGWTISVIAHLDVKNGLWLGGDGTRRKVTPTKVGDSLVVVSADDTTADVFDASGQELRRVDLFSGLDLGRFTYTDGKLTSITDTDGTTTIERDPNGAVTAIDAPLGARTLVYLDSSGELTSLLSASGRGDSFAYGPGGLLTAWTDRNGQRATYQYDESGRLTQVGNRDGTTTTFTRTATADGATVEATRSGIHVPTQWSVKRASDGWTWSMTTPAGDSIAETVQNDHRSVQFSDGSSLDIVLAPDATWGDQAPIVTKLSLTTASGRTLSASETRAAAGDPLSATSLDRTITIDGRETKEHYDAGSRTATITTAVGRTTTIGYGDFARISTIQRPASAPVAYGYDAHGRVTSVTVGQGAAARTYAITRDPEANAATITDPTGAKSTVAFDADGRPQVWQRADGQRVVLDRSDAGAPIGVSVNGQATFVIGVDANGRLTSYAPAGDGSLDVTQLDYVDGRLKSVNRPDGTTASVRYDDAGRLAGLDAGQGEFVPTYSSSGTVTGWTEPGKEQTSQTLDGGLPSSLGWTGPVSGAITIGRDAVGRITSLVVGGEPAVQMTYDADGLLTNVADVSIQRDPKTGLPSSTTVGTVTTTESYDALGQPATTSASAAGGDLFRETLTRDGLGRIVRDDVSVAGSTSTSTYRYDAGGRLAAVSTNGHETTLAYDDRDNLTALAGSGSRQFDVNGRNQVSSDGTRTLAWTTAGTLSTITAGAARTSFRFDGRQELVGVDLPDGHHLDYLVDEHGQLIGRLRDGSLSAGYLYLPGTVAPVAQVDATGHVVATFEYAGPGAPVAIRKGSSTYRVVSDHLGSPRLVVDASSGAVVERLDYDVLGRIVADTNPGFQPFGFAGGIVDSDTGFVRLGVRWYDPTVGRWTSPDPALIAAGPNLYEYANDDWVNEVDRSGRYPTPDFGPIDVTSPFNGGESSTDPSQNMSVEPADVPLPPSGDASASEGSSEGTTGAGGEGGGEDATPGLVPWSSGLVGVVFGGASIGAAAAGGVGHTVAPIIGIAAGAIEIGEGAHALATHEGPPVANAGKVVQGVGEVLIGVGVLTGQPELIAAGFPLLLAGASAQILGDPHFTSLDGNLFDFQGAGEYVLIHDTGGGLDVQVRLEPRGGSRVVSVVTAVAIGVAGGHRIGIYRGGPHELLIDGRPVDLPAGAVNVGAGARVIRLPSGHYVVALTDGSFAIEVAPRGGASINLRVGVKPDSHHLSGLMGSADGNAANDFTARDGTALAKPDFDAIHHRFGESWRVSAAESLFDYAPGTSTASYTDRSFPDHEATVNDVPASTRQTATAVCQGAGIASPRVLNACILDVGLLHDASFAGGLVDMNATAVSLGSSGVGHADTYSISVGTTVGPDSPAAGAGRIAAVDSRQQYSLQLDGNTPVYLAALQSCSTQGIVWSVVLPDGTTVGGEPSVCQDIGPVRVSAAGVATITVLSQGGTGTYGFSVLPSEPVQRFPVAAGSVVSSGSPGPGAGSIDRPGGEDDYTLTGASGDAFYIAAAAGCVTGGIRWQLQRPDGSMQGGIASVCSDLGEVRFDAAGTWTIAVAGDGQATGPYGFTVFGSEPVTVFSLGSGGAVSPGSPGPGAGRIDRPGGEDDYTFTGSVGQVVRLTPGPDCVAGRVVAYLLPPGASRSPGAGTGGAFGGIADPCTGPTTSLALNGAGTWTMVVVGSGSATGSYGFSLSVGSP